MNAAHRSPIIVILGGPNGAGKTTSAKGLLADTLGLTTFVNADILAQGLAGFSAEDAAWDAGRIMLARLDQLADARASFAFETTLAGRAYVRRIDQWRQAGYRVILYYYWLRSVELAIERVENRVQAGGHRVAESVIRERYPKSLCKFFRLFMPRVDFWKFVDNSDWNSSRTIATGGQRKTTRIADVNSWNQLQILAKS